MNEWMLVGVWISLLLGLGGLVFPLVWMGFGKKLADGGFGVSVVGGIVLTGWLVFMMASLRLVGFGFLSAAISLGLIGVGSGLILWKNRKDFAQFIRRKRILLLIELGLLIFSVIGWSFVRGFQPDIQGLEKFMDMGFVNAILRSKWMPPTDMWLSGYKINYYYFGHFLTAFLTLVSGIDSAYTYNLMLATVFGLSMLGAFSFVYNFLAGNKEYGVGSKVSFGVNKKFIITAVLTALFLNFGGNLHTAWHFLSGQAKPYWYPDATRFIQYTIHEFPMYSHVVADLHGHLIDLPIVLLFLTVLIAFFQGLTLGEAKVRPFEPLRFSIFLGFLLGIMSMTNTWDVPIYGLIFAAVAAITVYKLNKQWRDRLLFGVTTGLAVSAAMVLTSFPFHLNFQNIAQGLAWVETRSPLWQLGVLWGGFGVIGAVAVWRFSFGRSDLRRSDLGRLGRWLPMAMIGVSALLILIPEIVYVKDIYIKEYHRANTMFKLTYQAFVMMSLVWGVAVGSIAAGNHQSYFINHKYHKFFSKIAIFLLLLVFGLHMMYPFLAIPSYYNGLKKFQGLYGLQWLARQYPNDYQVIDWMKRNIPWQLTDPPTVLEAVGESYTDHARVSAFTGLPTVVGWRVHEWLWRGSFDIPGQRTEEVRTMYEKPNSPEAEKLFKQYKVRYIFVGDLERQDYKLNEAEIEKLGKTIFRSGSTYLVKL